MSGAGTGAVREGRHRLETVALALLAYVPFLLSSPGRLASDTKQYLYLDPGRFLSRVPYLWDSQVAAGTVPHQQVGYLFPMGPFFWAGRTLGLPVWVTQRLWLGSISFLAVIGARWLFRRLGLGPTAALVASLVYLLTPYQLAFTARISILLLPWAALPWIVGLTMRATERGGWADPAAVALIVTTIGSVNASSMLLAAVGPAVWIGGELLAGRRRARAALGATLRIATLTVLTCAWWIAGLVLQGSEGLPVLQFTETVRTVSAASAPGDILRGLGNWFLFGYDRTGYSLVQAASYLDQRSVVAATCLVPALAFLAGTFVRWRHRSYLVALVVVGTVVGVGAWPYRDPSPWGRVWKAFTDSTAAGLALRNTPRVVPVVVLGLAGLIGAGVGGLRAVPLRRAAALAVAAVLAVGFLPVWRDGYLSPGVERPEALPRYWTDAIRAIDADSHRTRVLEIPGSAFATYRWGNTVEPVTPGLTDRPYLAREVLPAGSRQSVNLLDAFDRRIQNGTLDPTAVAPLARLFGVGTVATRNDLAYERSGGPHPRELWRTLTDPPAPGLGPPEEFGTDVANHAPGTDAVDLRTPVGAPSPPAVALFPVRDGVGIVRTSPDRDPVILAGDGDGIVDAAGAGLLTGRERLTSLADLTDAQLRHALDTGGALVLTDSNRRRNVSYFSSIRDTAGPTQRAGQTTKDVNGNDVRVDLFRDRSDSARSVVETTGGTVTASADGGAARPEDRATAAFDGDPATAWRVGGADPQGNWVRLRPDRPVRADHVTLVQPLDLPRDRQVTSARVTVNGDRRVDVHLGPESFTAAGQRVDFPTTTVRSLRVEITGVSDPPFAADRANAVGFAEIRLADVVVHETVRLPVDLARRVGARAAGRPLAIVLTRLRQETALDGRRDEEATLDRRFVVPDTRAFALNGVARANPNAPDPALDALLGTAVPGTRFAASSHLRGDVDARASRAFTGTAATHWTSAFGPQAGQWIRVTGEAPVTADHVDLSFAADDHHSVPGSITVTADGHDLATVPVPPGTPTAGERSITLPVPATTAREWQLTMTTTAPPAGTTPAPVAVPPVALDRIGIPGVPAAPLTGTVSGACRTDVVRLDGAPLGVRITGAPADARRGWRLLPCAPVPTLAAGSHRLETAAGLDTGLDVDRIALTSGADGRAAPLTPVVAATTASPTVRAATHSPVSSTAYVTGRKGEPFWLVLGQSTSDGWHASVGGKDLGRPELVDGYAMGWRVVPRTDGPIEIALRWQPQRGVWIAFGVSALAALGCLLLVIAGLRRRRRAHEHPGLRPDAPRLASWRFPGRSTASHGAGTVLLAAAVLVVATVGARLWIGLVAAAAALLVALVPRLRLLLGVAGAALLLVARVGDRPELAWLALAWFATAVVVSEWSERRDPPGATAPGVQPDPSDSG